PSRSRARRRATARAGTCAWSSSPTRCAVTSCRGSPRSTGARSTPPTSTRSVRRRRRWGHRRSGSTRTSKVARVATLAGDRYIVISSDCHAGANMLDYRDYLEQRWHDEFDAWAAAYQNPFDDLRNPEAARNWDSGRRMREIEDDGVVAEVLFPNTVPPFFP